MATNFKVAGSNFEDVYLRRELFSQGGLWGCGTNGNGQLGDGTTLSKSSPVQTVAGGIDWKEVSKGYFNSAGIKTDGTLWLWGRNDYGQLGDNTRNSTISPVMTASAGTNWKQVAMGVYHTGAIKTDGTLWLWGFNKYGQLGDSSVARKSSPVQTVAGGSDWKMVACGFYHSAAIKTNGTLWSWGQNLYGQLGDNTSGAAARKSSPVQTVAGGTTWKLVSACWYHSAGIKTDGTLWSWGNNQNGAMGDNTQVNKSSPVQTVAVGTNWKQVIAAYHTTVGLKTDGTLWTWGNNTEGQLGDGTTVAKTSPVQTVAGGTTWKLISAGVYTTAALKQNGTIWTWGNNAAGQLGDGTIVDKSSPVQTFIGGTNWKTISSFDGLLAIADVV